MLYKMAALGRGARASVEDQDLPNRCAKVRRKGGAVDVIIWQTGTARLLPRLLKGGKSGPVCSRPSARHGCSCPRLIWTSTAAPGLSY